MDAAGCLREIALMYILIKRSARRRYFMYTYNTTNPASTFLVIYRACMSALPRLPSLQSPPFPSTGTPPPFPSQRLPRPFLLPLSSRRDPGGKLPQLLRPTEGCRPPFRVHGGSGSARGEVRSEKVGHTSPHGLR